MLFAALLGGVAGLGEVIGRHADAPFSALRNWATVLLVTINAAASVIKLAMIQESNPVYSA